MTPSIKFLWPLQERGPGAPGQPLTAKSVVNAAPGFDDMASPTDSGSKGGIFSWLDSRQKEQEEGQTRKMEKWNEVMMKKQAQQKEAMEAAQAQAQAQGQAQAQAQAA